MKTLTTVCGVAGVLVLPAPAVGVAVTQPAARSKNSVEQGFQSIANAA